jgi:DNA polymerase-1
MTEQRRFILIDCYNFVFRAYYAVPPLTNSEGTPVNAVFGFASMLIKLLNDHVGHAALISDSGSKNFRHEIYPAYKANRPPAPDDLIPQFALVKEAAKAFNLPIIEYNGFEADDIIATIAKKASEAGEQVVIISSDKDLLQLLQHDSISIFDPLKNKYITREDVTEKYEVTPWQLLDFFSLVGDSSDNVPGIPGIGPKTAAKLINEYRNIDGIFNNIDQIKQPKLKESLNHNKDKAYLSKSLIALNSEVPLIFDFERFELHKIDPIKLAHFFQHHGFKSLISRIGHIPEITQKEQIKTNNNSILPLILNSSKEQFIEFLTHAKTYGKISIFAYQYNKDLIAIAVAIPEKGSCHIRLQKSQAHDLFNQDIFDIKEFRQIAKDILNDDSILKITYDAKKLNTLLGYNINAYDDIALLSYILNNGRHAHDLHAIIEAYHNQSMQEIEASATKPKVNESALAKYCASIASQMLLIYNKLIHELIQNHTATLYYKLDKPTSLILSSMERTGILIDRQILNNLSNEFGNRICILENDIYKESNCQFNIASPKQLGEVLFKSMGLTSSKNAKGGNYSTDVTVLEELEEQGHKIATLLLEWRRLTKLKGTYTDALVNEINHNTGRVHTTFTLTGTTTGRLSSSDPNLQNIPIRNEEGNKIRAAFIAKSGHKIISADYSQIELRILAHMADMHSLQDAFRHGKDIHAITASQIFGVDPEHIDSNMRRKAKAVNFGIIYGISGFGLAKQLGISRSEAAHYIDRYFLAYPGIKEYMEQTKEQARTKGYVGTLFGRKCYIKNINDKNPTLRGIAERAAINAPIQGTASDIVKLAMIKVFDMLSTRSLEQSMLLQIHDELLFELPEAELLVLKAKIKEVMENVYPLKVPLVASVKEGNNWSEAH